MTATYRDFSNAMDTETAVNGIPNAITSSCEESYQPLSASRTAVDHYMLGEIKRDGLDHIVSWQPHGRCFIVHKQKDFEQRILPFWSRQTKLASFQRQLNIYGFQRITTGRDKNGYYHELFLRGKRFLAKRIQRNKIKGQGPRKPGAPDSEPNFYTMPVLPEDNEASADSTEAATVIQPSHLALSIDENGDACKRKMEDDLMAFCNPLHFSTLRKFLRENHGTSFPNLVSTILGSNQSFDGSSYVNDNMGNSHWFLSNTELAGPSTNVTLDYLSQNSISNAIDQALLLAHTSCFPPIITSNPQVRNQEIPTLSVAVCLLNSAGNPTAFEPDVRSLQNLTENDYKMR